MSYGLCMKILLAGGYGQLGKALITEISNAAGIASKSYLSPPLELNVLPRSLDVRNLEDVLLSTKSSNPDWVVNAAAYTQVDRAQVNPREAISTNANGAANMAIAASQIGAKLVYFSTESVFDGQDLEPYSEESLRNPLSVYSVSKSAGEDLSRMLCDETYVVRTSWLYGDSSTANFPARLTTQLHSSEAVIPVVTDLVGNPTPTNLLAEAVVSMFLNPPATGTYHICSQGACSKYEWAIEISKSLGFSASRIAESVSDNFPSPAKRSKHVDLSCAKFLATGLLALPHWSSFYGRV